MDPGRLDRMNRPDARYLFGQDRADQLVDELGEHRVFLGWPAYDREMPDRVLAVIHMLHPHHWEVVSQAVVAQVIAEGPFGQQALGLDETGEAEVGLGVDGELARTANHRDPTSPQHAGKHQFAHSFRQRHDGGHGHGRRSSHEHVDHQFFAPADRRRMMGCNPTMNLIVQPDLAIHLILVAGQLDAIHAQVGLQEAGIIWILGVNLGKGNERSPIHGATT